MRSRPTLIATAIITTCLLTGCTQPELGPTSPTTPTTITTPTATPTPTPTWDTNQQNAARVVKEFQAMYVRIAADPKANLNDIYTVARGTASETRIRSLEDLRIAKKRMTGTSEVEILRVEEADTDREWEVVTCEDATGVKIFDGKGKDISPKREFNSKMRYTVQHAKDNDKWFVMDWEGVEKC